MLKKTITYMDFNGLERSEDYYFNISKSELAEMELSIGGGLSELLQKIVREQNMPEIIKQFKTIVLKAYGEKSLDGKYFNKSEEISDRFFNSGAYDCLFMELISNPEYAAEFIKGIMPKSLTEEK